MKGLDILIVRFLPFVLYTITGISMLCLYCGYDITLIYELHGNSILYALGLLFISLANSHYHCVWNRAMYAFLIATPLLNFLDSAFYIFHTDAAYLNTVLVIYASTAIATAYLAIRHFIQVSKRRFDNGNR